MAIGEVTTDESMGLYITHISMGLFQWQLNNWYSSGHNCNILWLLNTVYGNGMYNPIGITNYFTIIHHIFSHWNHHS